MPGSDLLGVPATPDPRPAAAPRPAHAPARRRVLVTGAAAVTPLGLGTAPLLDRWLDGECGIAGGRGACEAFDPSAFLSPRDARRMDRCTQMAVVAAALALADAAWGEDGPPCEPTRAGCVLGTAFGGIATLEEHAVAMGTGRAAAPSSTAVPMALANAATGVVAQRAGLRGTTFPISSACAAGADAIAIGARLIEVGVADVMVVGASEAPFTPFALAGLANMRALSATGRSRPFDARRDGFVLGEGAAVLVLEADDVVRHRHGTATGAVLGSGIANDNHHMTMPAPDGSGFTDAMRLALADAGLDPADVDYINAHGTSTRANDRVETLAIKRVLGEHAARVPVSSTKSAIGHQLGAAGAIDAVATLEALRRRVAPPTLGYAEPDDDLDLDYVPERGRPLAVPPGRAAIGVSNSAGFGGHNTTLCLSAA